MHFMGLFSGFFKKKEEEKEVPLDFHQLSFRDINGEERSLSEFKGKFVFLINVASECGFTPQYTSLVELQNKYPDKLQVLGFPCNQFGGQEPGTETEIAHFCDSTYSVNFPISEKINVKGKDAHPVYMWLTNKAYNGKISTELEWNFQKYLVSPEGEFLSVFYSGTDPLDPKISKFIK